MTRPPVGEWFTSWWRLLFPEQADLLAQRERLCAELHVTRKVITDQAEIIADRDREIELLRRFSDVLRGEREWSLPPTSPTRKGAG